MNVQVSSEFKKMTSKAITSIAMFILVYLVLLVLSFALTGLCLAGGIGLIILKPMVVTLGVGIGLASLGFFIVMFLFKFMFKKHKIDRSNLTEITQKQEPQLFQFIQEIVEEVQTDFPKKIYLSSDVNACVFYDSSFWSMFFPIKKNLQIGLGLVNTISKQEFKAILAHEFGHFSQKSMKVGSYVYHVNQVIYNMLYDNESFDNMIQKWANVSGYFSFFAAIAIKIIQGIQWILKKMYDYINVSYMALSREMEFHADEVAANVAGYKPLKESLLRMDLADHSYYAVLNFYENKIENNVKSLDIFKEQQFVMNFLAKESELPFKDNLPLVSEMDRSKYNKSKLNIKDQWASHPSTEDRVKALEKLNIIKDFTDTQPALNLFNQPENISKILTKNLFANVNYEGDTSDLEIENFEKEYSESYKINSFNKKYNCYYDDKNPNQFDIKKTERQVSNENFDSLFDKQKVDMVYDYIALVNDKNVLDNITNGYYPIKTFDYDGQKYASTEAESLIKKLEKEADKIKENITQNDKEIYCYFINQAKTKEVQQQLQQMYEDFFAMENEFESLLAIFTEITNSTYFTAEATPNEQIKSNFESLKTHEEKLKSEIKKLLEKDFLQAEITKPMKENFEKYISQEWIYFSDESYDNDNLGMMFAAKNDFRYLLYRNFFLTKKQLLDFQTKLIEN
jgi:Zn-dependent protease with chaperone function